MEHLNSAVRRTTPEPAATTGSATQLPQLLPPRDAARAMSVSERTLFTLTKRGDVRAVRIGRSVRYDPADLRQFIDGAKDGEAK